MLKSLRHRSVAVWCAMAALLPNVGKVSVLGSRAVPSIISAADPAEETVFSATAAEAETAAAGVKNLAPQNCRGRSRGGRRCRRRRKRLWLPRQGCR